MENTFSYKVLIWFIFVLWFQFFPSTGYPQSQNVYDKTVRIQLIEPDPRGGKAYRLIYVVGVPLEIYWRFKTDFDNDFLIKHKYIEKHRFLGRKNNTVLIENEYTIGPDAPFKWKTKVYPDSNRLEFDLVNPGECHQRFHYGEIRLKELGRKTKVVQEAYFDFFGATLWAYYPWSGGMKSFFRYTARWEQNILVKLKSKYTGSDQHP